MSTYPGDEWFANEQAMKTNAFLREQEKPAAAPVEPAPDVVPPPVCADCGVPYAAFPLDMTLPDDQWATIFPNINGLLCARCIVARAANLPGVVAVRARIEFAEPTPAVVPPIRSFARTRSINKTRELLACEPEQPASPPAAEPSDMQAARFRMAKAAEGGYVDTETAEQKAVALEALRHRLLGIECVLRRAVVGGTVEEMIAQCVGDRKALQAEVASLRAGYKSATEQLLVAREELAQAQQALTESREETAAMQRERDCLAKQAEAELAQAHDRAEALSYAAADWQSRATINAAERDAALARAEQAESRVSLYELTVLTACRAWADEFQAGGRHANAIMLGQSAIVEGGKWLLNRLERAERLIKQVEWDGGNEDFLGGWCPWCRGSREMMYGSSGHEPDCPAFGQQTSSTTQGEQP